MEKRHYSDKGGHKERSVVNKLLRQGVINCKSEHTFTMRRHVRRITNDGKR